MTTIRLLPFFCVLATPLTLAAGLAGGAAQPYSVLAAARVGGEGGYDYVTADPDGRRLYVPRQNRVDVFDLDTLKPAGRISGTPNVHGVVLDPLSHHGFCSSNPVIMWDTRTLAPIKSIVVGGEPDGILFDPATRRVFVLSHETPNATVLDARDGRVVGTIADLGGAPEQGAADGRGRLYIDLEDQDSVSVVDAARLQVTGRLSLQGHGGTPAGMAMDTARRILFVCCRKPQAAVILGADDGRILATLPIGAGVDSACFNPATGEAFSSQRDGTLTVIREAAPDRFEVEQTVTTRQGAKTSTLDPVTGRLYLIAADRVPAAPQAGAQPQLGTPQHRPKWTLVPGSFTIIEVGHGTPAREATNTP
jgi:DNA-binding beta-propeller fold protein YncE